MFKTQYFILLFISVFLISCADQAKNKPISDTQSKLSILQNPCGENSAMPRLFSDGQDVYMSWVQVADSVSSLHYAKLQQGEWSSAEEIISGSDWFVNWADFPAIAANNGHILTNFLQKSADGTYTYDVKLNCFDAGTGSWKKDFILHTDGTKSEHGFVSVVPYEENGFFVSWLDGRNTMAAGHDDHTSHGGGAMTLRAAVVNGKGEISSEVELDDRVCDCCQTSTAMTTNGPIVVYRDRSEEEVRDISIIRRVDGEWLAPQTIGTDRWLIKGCPVNGPAVDAIEDKVVIAWFTAEGGEGKVNLVFSEDGGASFGEAVRVDSGNATGRVDVAMLNQREAAVVWMEPKGDEELLQLRIVDSNGSLQQPATISKTTSNRSSGFPQLEKLGNSLMLAWTVVEDGIKQINTAQFAFNQ